MKLFLFPLFLGGMTLAWASDSAPKTPKKPVINEYHGVKVEDDYQWLERNDDPAVKAWSAAENQHARAYLDKIPDRPLIAERLRKLFADASPTYSAIKECGGRLFALKFQPPKQQPLLVTLASADDLKSEKVVLDPNELDAKGGTGIDWFVPSLDGKKVAISLSHGGSEDGDLHFYDVETAKALPDTIAHVQFPTAGGSAAWTADDHGIFYTRFPRKGERPEADLHFYQQIYFHKIGTPESEDTYSLGKEFPRIAEIVLESSRDGRSTLAIVANGDGGDFAHYLRTPAGEWKQLTKFTDQVKQAHLGRDDALYLVSRAGAPRGKILRLPLDHLDLAAAKVIVPAGEAVVQDMEPTSDALYVVDLLGGPSQIRRFDLEGKNEQVIRIPAISAVQEMVALENHSLLFKDVSYIAPNTWFRFQPDQAAPVPTALRGASPVSFDDIEVTREFALSKDGKTKIPLNIMRRKGTRLDGKNPTLLYAYGGYGISLSPSFDFMRRLWFDRGGIYVVANLRGGGEYGEEWHKAGNLTNKQNVFDDFVACENYLIKKGYTSPEQLALMGGSNGGLLMGAVLTQHPELAQTVVSLVGIYDSLRTELEPNGAFNVTEFGSVKDPAQFEALRAYSPYHNVKDGTKYPAVLFLTGENDGRVAPYNSRKMTARLQAANASENPILLRTSANSGHGHGTALSERIEQQADIFAFLFARLKMEQETAKTAAR